MDDNIDVNSKKVIKRQDDRKDKDIDDENVDDEDSKGDETDEHSEDDNSDKDDKLYIDQDAAVLSHGPTPILPCTIRYMDLTCLNLQHIDRVPQVLLIQDERDAVVNIFNKRPSGK